MKELVYRESKDGVMIKGVGIPLFDVSHHEHKIVLLKIYEDGLINYDSNPLNSLDFNSFKEYVDKGFLSPKAKNGTVVSLGNLFEGIVENKHKQIDEENLLKDVKDILDTLQGKESVREKCWKAFIVYINSPSANTKSDLESAYNAVPDDKKVYVLSDQDEKDGPILSILHGEVLSESDFEYLKSEYND